jgi:general stress protein YciG
MAEKSDDNPKKLRGFAAMPLEQRREISAMGGKAVPAEKRNWNNRDLAAAAGRLGGYNLASKKRSFSRDVELARAAGQKGGLAKSNAKQEAKEDR